jgi:deazaflavin-dependent oxidoreductase (nitroreductase family)
MNGNNFMAWVLRSPFHGMLSGGMLLVTVTGRKTGKAYTLPVEYVQEDGSLWVMSKRNRRWWRNLEGEATVGLVLRRKSLQGVGRLHTDPSVVQSRLAAYLLHMPMSAKALGVRMENKIPNPEDLARVASDLVFIQIELLK